MRAYTDNRARVSAIIKIPILKAETFRCDFSQMLRERRTFDESMSDPALPIMTRHRLKMVKAKIFQQLDNVAVL